MKVCLRCRRALMVKDGAFSHKIFFLDSIPWRKCNAGSRVTKILLKGLILPIGGASLLEGLQSMGLTHLVFSGMHNLKKNGCLVHALNNTILCWERNYLKHLTYSRKNISNQYIFCLTAIKPKKKSPNNKIKYLFLQENTQQTTCKHLHMYYFTNVWNICFLIILNPYKISKLKI